MNLRMNMPRHWSGYHFGSNARISWSTWPRAFMAVGQESHSFYGGPGKRIMAQVSHTRIMTFPFAIETARGAI